MYTIWLVDVTEQQMKDVRNLLQKDIGTRIGFNWTGSYYSSLKLSGLTREEYTVFCELFPKQWRRGV